MSLASIRSIRWPAGFIVFVFFTGIHMTAQQNVGIGTLLPKGILEIEKLNITAADNYLLVLHNPSNTTGTNAFIGFSGSGAEAGTDGFNPGSIGYIRGTGLVFRANTSSTPLTRMTIHDASGNVGIGTTTPQSRLDVEGGMAVGVNYSGATAAPVNGAIIEGRVGIGTSTTDLSHLTVNCDAASTSQGIRSMINFMGNNDIRAIYAQSITNPGWGYGAELIGGYIGVGGIADASGYGGDAFGVRGVANGSAGIRYGVAGLSTSTGPAQNIGIYGVASNATSNWAGFFIGRGYFSDNVGIGITNPGEKLHVNGNILTSTVIAETGDFKSPGILSLRPDSDASGDDIIRFMDNTGVETARMHSNNNFGIGTNNPLSRLHVKSAGVDLMRLERGDISQVWGFDAANADFNIKDISAGTTMLTIQNATGRVGIGTTNPQSPLAVNGKITCTEVEVTLAGWPDYVFDETYPLKSLDEVERHIRQYKHLPGIPSEKEVMENGVEVGEMQAKLLQKIEELTLYVIELKKENARLSERVYLIEHK